MPNCPHIDIPPGDAGKSVLVAMSGGVDSSAASILLQEAGMELHGCTLILQDDQTGISEQAAKVAGSLGFDHDALDYRDAFAECVVKPFCRSYLAGETPNPCIDCNKHLKFGALHDVRKARGLDYLATGHYVRRDLDERTGLYRLRRGVDASKDQSYFLSHMSQEVLARTLFPLGELTKKEVRQIARGANLSNAEKPESQDICFIENGDYVSFVERVSEKPSQPGPIELEDGKVVGRHDGILRYTIGQRKGIGVAAAEPLFVIGIDAERNALIVGPRESLMTQTVRATNASFVSGDLESIDELGADGGMEVEVQTHYRQKPVKGIARIACCCTGSETELGLAGNAICGSMDGESDDMPMVEVALFEPIVKPAIGQTLALYNGDIVLGGGIICA